MNTIEQAGPVVPGWLVFLGIAALMVGLFFLAVNAWRLVASARGLEVVLLGELQVSKTVLGRERVKVFSLRKPNEPAPTRFRLEVIGSGPGSWTSMPVTLSADQAKTVSRWLDGETDGEGATAV